MRLARSTGQKETTCQAWTLGCPARRAGHALCELRDVTRRSRWAGRRPRGTYTPKKREERYRPFRRRRSSAQPTAGWPKAGGDAQWGVGRLDGFPALAEAKLRGVGIKHTKRQAGSAQRGRTRLHGKTRSRSLAGRRARCCLWEKADARAQSNAEARARVRRAGVMRAGPEHVGVGAQPTHGRQQGGSAGLPQARSN